jgi:energy-coupling factor transporter ATP-binding protein EcfA2
VTYSFASLSPADFEDLARDLIGRELNCRFEAFGPGPDGGVDGRHARSGETVILQAKHYRGSGFAALARTMRKERLLIAQLAPNRYILVTSVSLTPANKRELCCIIGVNSLASEDIFGFEDLNALLRRHDDIAKSHVKLWLSDTAVLERILNAASHNFTNITRAGITAKLNVYAENPSVAAGRAVLERNRILIVSGPPGVGKTTLAEMLAYAYIGEDWDLIAIRGLDEGFARIDDSRRQLFFFDDFLGRIALDERALSNQDSEFVRFIRRVRLTPTARFILTTRAYIYEQAKLVSESLADQRLDVTRFVLDVGVYTRQIRARILYNHLIVAGVNAEKIRSLYESGTIRKIVDHQHYNPRIIERMTDPIQIGDLASSEYPSAFLDALNNPELIWDKAFRHHIQRRCQHLLFSLYFSSEYGAEIDDVREIFEGVHPLLCATFGLSSSIKDFEESVRSLEGSFISIANGQLSFVNPSVRDYLSRYLGDKLLLVKMAAGMPSAASATRLTRQYSRIADLTSADWIALLSGFEELCRRLNGISRWRNHPTKEDTLRTFDTSTSDRLQMLVRWWRTTSMPIFLETAEAIATNPRDGFSPWSDSRALPDLLVDLYSAADVERVQTEPLATLIEAAIRAMLEEDYVDPDILDGLIEAIDENASILGSTFDRSIASAIPRTIENLAENLVNIDSESTLNEYIDTIEKLAGRVRYNNVAIARAKEAVERRITEVAEVAIEDEALTVTGELSAEPERFDNNDLDNLFAPLVASDNKPLTKLHQADPWDDVPF